MTVHAGGGVGGVGLSVAGRRVTAEAAALTRKWLSRRTWDRRPRQAPPEPALLVSKAAGLQRP